MKTPLIARIRMIVQEMCSKCQGQGIDSNGDLCTRCNGRSMH